MVNLKAISDDPFVSAFFFFTIALWLMLGEDSEQNYEQMLEFLWSGELGIRKECR